MTQGAKNSIASVALWVLGAGLMGLVVAPNGGWDMSLFFFGLIFYEYAILIRAGAFDR